MQSLIDIAIKPLNDEEVKPTLNNIEAERARNRMSKEELARALGVSTRTYYNWISEETDITGAALVRLKEIFRKDIDYLMESSIHADRTTT